MWPSKSKVKIELLDAERKPQRRVTVEAKDAGFRVMVDGQWYERVDKGRDGVDRYVPVR